jgi:flagella basal body P-ring formation protein FlgA
MIALALMAAAAWQDTATLDRAVASFAGQPAGAEGGARTPVDPRLRLAACPMIALSWRTPAQDAVVVSCTGPDWRIFVPVRRAAPVAPVAPVAPTPGAVGRVLPVARAEPVIRRGDPVVIEADTEGFSVTRSGTAMADAAPGQHFAVRIDDQPRPVQAVAIEAGRAGLPGWAE